MSTGPRFVPAWASQTDNLDQELTLLENLVMYGRYFDISRRECRDRARELLEFVQLADRADSRVEPLSGGMKRRLTIARSLMNPPGTPAARRADHRPRPAGPPRALGTALPTQRAGVTLALTTHYMDEAEQLCDRLVVMDRGRIVAEGTPRGLIVEHSTREVLELRLSSTTPDDIAERLAPIGERVEVLPDRVLVYAHDGEAALASVHQLGIEPLASLVRRSSLEDVFLRLTGRSLVE